MSLYSFEIHECANGWLLMRGVLRQKEYFPTLNQLCLELLRCVDESFPSHRNTGAKSDKRVYELLDNEQSDSQEIGK